MDSTENNDRTLTLGSFLDSLDDGHRLIDEGGFSVSAHKALHKLESYSLADPGLYVVELLAFAVAQGSSRFHIQTDQKTCRAEFDGKPLGPDVLANPLSGLFSGKVASETHFALALSGAKQLCPEDYGVVYDDGRGTTLSLLDGEWKKGESDEQREHCTFVVSRPFRFLSEKLRKMPTLVEVLSTCKLAPLELRVNGTWCNGTPSSGLFKEELAGRLVLRGQYENFIPTNDVGYDLELETTQAYTALLYFGEVNKAREAGLVFVSNGVSYRTSAEGLGPGVCGIVLGAEVRRDLSGTGIVLDARYREIVESLRGHRDTYVNALLQSSARFRKATLYLRPLVEQLERTDEISKWLEVQDAEESALPRMERWKRIDSAARTEQREKLVELSYLEISSFLNDARKFNYRSEEFLKFASEQLWIRHTKNKDERLTLVLKLVALCRCLTGKTYDFLLSSDSSLNHFLHRVSGEPLSSAPVETSALEDDSWTFQSELEQHFLEAQYESVCEKCQLWLKASSPEEIQEPFIYDDIFPIEYWAQALELLGQKQQSAAVYKNLINYSHNDLTNSLRQEQWLKLVRAQMSFLDSLKTRVRIGRTNPFAFLFNWSDLPPREVTAVIQGRSVEQDKLLKAIRQYFDDRGIIYGHLFTFAYSTASHKLRLANKHKKADQVTALGRALLEAFRLWKEIAKG